ncbi:hypothetical protein MASR1M107_17120 [Ignavibacteriales bacterium]
MIKEYINDNIRRTEILARLMNKESLTLIDLCLEYAVSETTINRDLKFFRSLGLSIFSRKKVLFIENSPERELLCGYLAEYLAFKLNRKLLYDKLDAIIEVHPKKFFEVLTLSAKAVDERRYLKFRYERITDNIENSYTVKPIELRLSDYNWSLIAVKEGEEIEKLFYLSRIKEIELLNRNFVLGPEKPSDTIYDIELVFHPSCRNSIYSKIWFQSFRLNEREDGYFILETRAPVNKKLASWCLRWQDQIEVIRPEKLKIKIREMVDLFFTSNKF